MRRQGRRSLREWLKAKSHRGQSLVFVAISMVALLSMVALGIDGSRFFIERRLAQNAADSASLAGARALAFSGGDTSASTETRVLAEVNKMAAANGIETGAIQAFFVNASGSVTGSQIGTNDGVPSDAAGISVKTTSSSPSVMAQVVGYSRIGAGADTKVLVYETDNPGQSPGSGLMPIGVPEGVDKMTQPYDLWTPQNDYTGGAQYKGLLNFHDVTGPGYVNDPDDDGMNKPGSINYWTTYGYQGKIGLTDDVGLYNGDLGNNCASGLRAFINAHPQYDDPAHPSQATKYGIVYTPVYQYPFAPGQPGGYIHVIGFAAFKIYYDDVNSSSASGHFITYLNAEGLPGAPITPGYRGPVTIRMGS